MSLVLYNLDDVLFFRCHYIIKITVDFGVWNGRILRHNLVSLWGLPLDLIIFIIPMKTYKTVDDLPDWVKFITGGLAACVAEVYTSVNSSRLLQYLSTLPYIDNHILFFRKFDSRSNPLLLMEAINIADWSTPPPRYTARKESSHSIRVLLLDSNAK